MEKNIGTFRINDELARRVRELAKRDRRTIKAEYEVIIELGLDALERKVVLK